MKFVAITFDDGRKDNILKAYPIMNKYRLTGTVFVTTGYIDGTWKKDPTWLSAKEPLSIDDIRYLKKMGWEIALHGDKHITDIEDTAVSALKLDDWLGNVSRYGFSMPNSYADEAKLNVLCQECNGSGKLIYIRKGRGRDTTKLSSKILFALSSILKLQVAYNLFNKSSINYVDNLKHSDIKSVVVRKNDKSKMLTRFINAAPDNSLIVFMLHSIIEKGDELYNIDPWCWDSGEFDNFCRTLYDMDLKKQAKIINLDRIERLKKYVEL